MFRDCLGFTKYDTLFVVYCDGVANMYIFSEHWFDSYN